MREPLWKLEEAVTFFRALWEALMPVGFYVGLTGGVLVKGQSSHDLDIIIYPASSKTHDHAALLAALEKFGMKLKFDRDVVVRRWRKLGSDDEKHIEVWEYRGKRVDVFFLS